MIHLWPSFITLPVLTPSHRHHAPICIASTPRRALSPLQHQRQRRSDPSSDRQTLLTTKLDPVVVTRTRKLELQDTGGVRRILWPTSGCNKLTQMSRTQYPYQKFARFPSPTAPTMGAIGAPHGVSHGHLLGLIVRRRWVVQRGTYPPSRPRLGSSSGHDLSLGLRTAKLQLAARMCQILRITRFASSPARASVAVNKRRRFELCTRIQVNRFVRASKVRRKSEVILRGGLGLRLVF
ncbi:hypothetical protein DFH06DRAFT_1184261 [Mycena polygramma]|nr:hypothetical protein DFH06DRAFT_1184261 [Mycena polygramma]